MISRLGFQVILVLIICCKAFNTLTNCPSLECRCEDSKILICSNLHGSLNLSEYKPYNNTVYLEQSDISEEIFTSDSNLEDLERLKFVKCTFTKLTSNAFSSLPQLKKLEIKDSVIDIKELDLNSNSELEELDLIGLQLKDENITDLEKLLKQVPALKVLRLSNNLFEHFDSSILLPLKELETLIISDNRIEDIQPASLEFHLKELDLSLNRLSTVPSFVIDSSQKSLQILKLSDNSKLHEVNIAFGEFQNLNTVQLDHAILRCSCSWMKGMNESILSPASLMCFDFPTDQGAVESSTGVSDFVAGCRVHGDPVAEGGMSKGLVVVVVFLVLFLAAAIVGCLVHRILSNRKRRAQEKKAVRYSAVYRETVETSVPSSRTTIETKA